MIMTKNKQLLNLNEDTEFNPNLYFDETQDYSNVILDLDDGKNGFKHYFSDLHNPKYDKYFVPIFADAKMMMFRGNGVIVGKNLITAAHVAQSDSPRNLKDNRINYSSMWFLYDNNLIRITDENLIFDGRNAEDENGAHKDLAVYQLDDLKSDLVLNDSKITESDEFDIMPKKYCDGIKINREVQVCKIESLVSITGVNGNKVWTNCYDIHAIHDFYNGDSGGPVFVKNVIYGILIEVYNKEENKGIVLDSRFIKDIIDKHKKKG